MVSAISFAQKPIFTSAKAKAATVYFNGAELSQTTSVLLPSGTSEIVIKNVANYLNENTIQIGAPSSVTVLSVQFSDDYISEYEVDEKNPAIKKVRDSISYLTKEMKRIQNSISTENKSLSILEKNQVVYGTNSGLSVAELSKLMDYYKIKNNEILANVNSLNEKYSKLSLQIQNLNAKLQLDSEKSEKASDGKLILQVMNELAGTVNFDINYITNTASWKPFYDLRADNIKTPINMMYKAQVVQNSGIDWKKVKLTLSSGNPNQNNQQPQVNPWFLKYFTPRYEALKQNSSINAVQALSGKVSGLNIDTKSNENDDRGILIRGMASLKENNTALIVINGVVSTKEDLANLSQESIKSIDVLKGTNATVLYGSEGSNGALIVTTKQMDDYTSVNETQLNVSFDIDIPYDILSNGKAHSVALKEIKLEASYNYFAVPRNDKDAFLVAQIEDYSKYNLLPGEANIIFEGLYVGKTFINPNQTSDTLSLTMGRDKKIDIKREKVVDKSGTKFLSSYKEQTFTYDITVRNNKKEAIEMLLQDQYPFSSDKEISIELLQSDKAKIATETGILSWNLKLSPNETKKIRISYKVKYAKDKVIDNL